MLGFCYPYVSTPILCGGMYLLTLMVITQTHRFKILNHTLSLLDEVLYGGHIYEIVPFTLNVICSDHRTWWMLIHLFPRYILEDIYPPFSNATECIWLGPFINTTYNRTFLPNISVAHLWSEQAIHPWQCLWMGGAAARHFLVNPNIVTSSVFVVYIY